MAGIQKHHLQPRYFAMGPPIMPATCAPLVTKTVYTPMNLPRSCMKNMSATHAAPMPIPAEVPTPTNDLATRTPDYVPAAADAAWLATPRAVTARNTGRRQYALATGARKSGAIPAPRMATLVQ